MDTWIDRNIYQADLAPGGNGPFLDAQNSGDGSPRLVVSAHYIDTVQSVRVSLANNDPDPAEQAAFLQGVHDAISHIGLPAVTKETSLSAAALILAHLGAYFQPSRAELLNYLGDKNLGANAEWAHLSPCRHLFLMKSGLIGLSHGPISVGDKVFIIGGTRGHWVLRGLAQGECYHIVSPATIYPVHGNGEPDSRRQEISLC
ncbi:hypothetical protein F5Y10DRAFT_262699 [Nemania abortiva]|nr:hypothetical protein F5Y10DRAFT_262699 [Nemania abortiva]